MKKMVLAVTLLALAGTQVQRAEAHGGWGIAAGVTGGLIAGTIIGESIASQPPVYYAPAPAYYYSQPAVVAAAPTVCPAPTVVYQPAPVYYAAPRPVYYAPAPVVSIGFGFGRPYYHHGYYRCRCW